MLLATVDWLIIALFLLFSLMVGLWVMNRSGKDATEFFVAGKNMPWWLLGISMVATTFSTDTPHLVTDIVRQNGVARNWPWWAFLLTRVMAVFLSAHLGRPPALLTGTQPP